VAYQTGDPESIRLRKGVSQRFEEGIIGYVASTGKPIIANDVSQEPRYMEVHHETKSELSAPIRFGNRILGVLDVQSTELNAFTKEDLSALQILADQIAVGMENARLYEEARSKGDYLESMLRSATDAIVSTDSQGKVVEWNKGAEKTFGYTKKEAVGKRLDDLITSEDEHEEAAFITRRVMAGKEVIDFETIRRRNDGKPVNVLISASPIIEDTKFIGTVAIYKDITERKQAEEKLKESENFLKTILDSIQTGIAIIDAETHEIIDANPIAAKMIGAPKDKIIGFLCHKYICPAEKGKCPITDLGQKVDNSERVLLTANHETVPILKTVVTIMLKDRKCLLESFVDLTERKRAEEEIKKKNEELESFVYTVSHDLKAPLISIKGFSELLKTSSRGRLGEKGLHQLERIVSNIDEMNRLIGDLLKLSRVGRAVAQPREVNTLRLAKEIVEELNLRFKIDHPNVRYHNLPIIYTDRLHFLQILQNLLSNAYKFRDENKGLEIEVGCVEKNNTYEFYVRDNGIGIEKKHLENIFRIFKRLEEKEVEGTGAGLAIVKKIVENNGGNIWAESVKGKGSVFYFTFPKRVKPTFTKE